MATHQRSDQPTPRPTPSAEVELELQGLRQAVIPFSGAGTDWPPILDDRGLALRIADRLADAIIEMRLESGARLRETDIAAAFGISRTPVREALYILERDELVERPPRKGARVAEVTAKQVIDVYVCRAYLYGLSARMCATQLANNSLEDLERIVESMDAAVEARDIRTYFRLNVEFHNYVGRTTGNEMLLKLMGGMGRLTLRFRFMSLTIDGRLELSLHSHHGLLDDFRRHDADRAETRVREIAASAGDALLGHFFDDWSEPVRTAVMEI